MKKYDGVTRKRVWGEITKQMHQGLPSTRIGEDLRKQGFFMPDGKEPITDRYVGHTMTYLAKLEQGAKQVKVTGGHQLKTDRLPATVVGILTDPDLSAEQKVRMIIAYAEL